MYTLNALQHRRFLRPSINSHHSCKSKIALKARDEESSPVDDSKAEEIPPGGTVCSTCGIDKAAVPWGCDGQGRVMGGIGSVPGFGWWPIKAYRPCPAAEQRGIRYTRRGQDLDQVLWGGGKK